MKVMLGVMLLPKTGDAGKRTDWEWRFFNVCSILSLRYQRENQVEKYTRRLQGEI